MYRHTHAHTHTCMRTHVQVPLSPHMHAHRYTPHMQAHTPSALTGPHSSTLPRSEGKEAASVCSSSVQTLDDLWLHRPRICASLEDALLMSKFSEMTQGMLRAVC